MKNKASQTTASMPDPRPIDTYLQKKHNLPNNWRSFHYEVAGEPVTHILIRGTEARPRLKGRNKGKLLYIKTSTYYREFYLPCQEYTDAANNRI